MKKFILGEPKLIGFTFYDKDGNGRFVSNQAPCPNCGVMYSAFELNHQSHKRIETKNGTLSSTLYGVCEKCANNHKR